MTFEPDGVQATVIKEDAEYEGIRVKLIARLEQARIPMQIDFGFGDAVQPAAMMKTFPVLLTEIPTPVPRMYPPEVVIAEKLHAMVVLDIGNSRMKDFYDVWYLAQTGSFELSTLRVAVRATFNRRRTQVPSDAPFALGAGFLLNESKMLQWRGFVQRLQLEQTTPSLSEVGIVIAEFLNPLWTQIDGQHSWSEGGPWQSATGHTV